MRKSDVLEINGKRYTFYFQSAMDGKRWCRVKVEEKHGYKYQYGVYFRTKKAAKHHVLAVEAKK